MDMKADATSQYSPAPGSLKALPTPGYTVEVCDVKMGPRSLREDFLNVGPEISPFIIAVAMETCPSLQERPAIHGDCL